MIRGAGFFRVGSNGTSAFTVPRKCKGSELASWEISLKPKLPIKKIIGERQDRCLYYSGTKIIKKGRRRKKFETVQLWYCKDCDSVFGPRALKGKPVDSCDP